jgi:hypothetical protein
VLRRPLSIDSSYYQEPVVQGCVTKLLHGGKLPSLGLVYIMFIYRALSEYYGTNDSHVHWHLRASYIRPFRVEKVYCLNETLRSPEPCLIHTTMRLYAIPY